MAALGEESHGTGLHQIGDIARRTHLSLRTLRYWEEVGLIRSTGRTAGGFRLYSDDELARVQLVRAMKPADLTIDELRELADLVDEVRSALPSAADATNVVVAARLEAFIARIRTRCEVLRGQIDDAEGAALELERLIEEAISPERRRRGEVGALHGSDTPGRVRSTRHG